MFGLLPLYKNPPKTPSIKAEAQSFISEDEFNKTIDALRARYNISECDALPYYPKLTKIILHGEQEVY